MFVGDDRVHFPVCWGVAGVNFLTMLVDIDAVLAIAANGITREPFAIFLTRARYTGIPISRMVAVRGSRFNR